MSTRVQKGSTIFKPVAKARLRAPDANVTSRQPSVMHDSRPPNPPQASSQQHISTLMPEIHVPPPAPSSSMPPPFVVPTITSTTAVHEPQRGPSVLVSTPILLPTTRNLEISQPLPALPIIQESPAPPVAESESQASGSRKRRSQSRASSEGPRKSRKTRESSLPYDPDADPGEDLDPTAVTMAALCDDSGWGRVSSKAAQIVGNHLTWKKSNREKRARMRSTMEAKKYGRNEDDTAQPAQINSASEQSTTANGDVTSGEPNSTPMNGEVQEGAFGDPSDSGFDYSQDVATSRYNVQIRIGPNGETIIDEESLFVDRNATDETADYTHVEESDVTKFVNSSTYGKRFRGSRWSAEETELFYDALSQFGENYELISYVLPGRDRKSCKNKFKAEDKKNAARINYCLNNRRPYDMQTLSRMTGKDFSGPTPEIRPPTVLTLAETGEGPSDATGDETISTAIKVNSSSLLEDGEEVLGDISSYEYEK